MGSPEFTSEQLEKARREITDLYMGDQMEKALGGFQGAANTHQPFTDKINSLRQSFKVVVETQKEYDFKFQDMTNMFFEAVEDMMARKFLGDVLISRMICSPRYLDYGIVSDEAQAMAQEMGLDQGWRTEPGTKITLDQAVEAALTDRLRFEYQPKSFPGFKD